MKWFSKRLKEIIDPMLGQTVIHFITHGCMAEQHEFEYIGVIVGTTYPRLCDGKKFYRVQVEKYKGLERRDGSFDKFEFQEVPSWYLQKMNGFYIAYD